MGSVTCILENAPRWDNSSFRPFLQKGEAHVWRVSNLANPEVLYKYQTFLTAGELEKCNRFFKAADQVRYINSHAALRIILSKYIGEPAGSIILVTGKYNKPQLAALHHKLSFNLSHSGDFSLVGISANNIGVDVEIIDNQIIYEDLINDYFSRNEAAIINSSTQPVNTFYTHWTRKEALLKGISTGLNTNIQHAPSADGTHYIDPGITSSHWVNITFSLDQNHVGSAAIESEQASVKFFNFEYLI